MIRTNGLEYTLPCSHNFFTENGKNIVRDMLGGSGVIAPGIASTISNVSQICVGNGSSTNGDTIGATTTAGNSRGCYVDSGLTNKSGTFAVVTGVNNQNGNWSLSATFTATADNKNVNATGLLNGSSTGSQFFANNTFTQVTLNTNDQITIRWNMSVS